MDPLSFLTDETSFLRYNFPNRKCFKFGGISISSPYFSYTIDGDFFQLFSLSHLVVLGQLFLLALLLYLFRSKIRRPLYRYVLAFILLLSEVAFQMWHFFLDRWSLEYMLPLQLCSVSVILSVIMLITNSYRTFELTFFWGLGGAGQAMITPELFYPFPHFRFFHFFIAHEAIILACLYMTWVEGFRPTLRSMWKAVGYLNVLLVFTLYVNHVTGGNYLFVSRKPSNPSLIDYLGPYPWYILSLESAAIFVFYLLYLLFSRKKQYTSVSVGESSH